MNDAPERIYLQWTPQLASQATWSAEKIDDADVPYIRAYIARSEADALRAELDAALARVDWLTNERDECLDAFRSFKASTRISELEAEVARVTGELDAALARVEELLTALRTVLDQAENIGAEWIKQTTRAAIKDQSHD